MSAQQKDRKTMFLVVFYMVAVIVVAVGVIYAISTSENRDNRNQSSSACPSGQHADHLVTIKHNAPHPEHLTAPRCDNLTISNSDDVSRLLAFGLHDHHEPYDGVTEQLLPPGKSLTVTLNQTGNFRFHDHLDDTVQGTFTVK